MASPRTDQEIALVRNDEWSGDFNRRPGRTGWRRSPSSVTADPDTSYNSFEAGEGDNANIPPARTSEAQENYGTTLDVAILGSYHYDFNFRDPLVGGDENLLFRQAISQAIDREEINAGGLRRQPDAAHRASPRRASPGFAPGPL